MADMIIDLTRLDPRKPLPAELKRQIKDRVAEAGYTYQSQSNKDSIEPFIPKRQRDDQAEKSYQPNESIPKRNIERPRPKSKHKEFSWSMGQEEVTEVLPKKVPENRESSKVMFSHSERPISSIDRSPGFLDTRSYLTKKMSQKVPRPSTKDPFYYADRFGSETPNTPLVIKSRHSIIGELSDLDLHAVVFQLHRRKNQSSAYSIVSRLKSVVEGGSTLSAGSSSFLELEERKSSGKKASKHRFAGFTRLPRERRKSEEEGEEEEEIEEEEIVEWTEEMQTGYLNALEVMALVTQIDNGLDELAIIESLLPKDRPDEDEVPKSIILPDKGYKSPQERFGHESTELREEINDDAKEFLKKLQDVRTFAADVLKDTQKGLEDNSSFWQLFVTVEDQKQMKKDEKKMEKMYSHWDEKIADKKKAIKETMAAQEEAVVIAEIRHLQLMDELDAKHRTVDAQQRYVERWEKARQEQHRMFLEKLLKDTRKRLGDVNELIDNETERYAQVKTMGDNTGKTPEKRMERLMSKWEDLRTKDVEIINKKIAVEKYKLHNARKETKTLEREFKKREHAINEFQRVQVLQEAQVAAAKRIQRWWRLIMYSKSASVALQAAKTARRAILRRQRKMRARFRRGTVLLPPVTPRGVWRPPKKGSNELKKKIASLPNVPYKPTKAELLKFKAEENRRQEVEKRRLKTLDYIIDTIDGVIKEKKLKVPSKKPSVKEPVTVTKEKKESLPKQEKPQKVHKIQTRMSVQKKEWSKPLEFGTKESWELVPATILHSPTTKTEDYDERVVSREKRETIKRSGESLAFRKRRGLSFHPASSLEAKEGEKTTINIKFDKKK